MIIDGANTEPFITFVRTREDLDRTIKVTTGAIRDLEQRAKGGNAQEVVRNAVAAAGEPWGAVFSLSEPTEQIGRTLEHLSGLWVSAYVSALHRFLEGTTAEQERWAAASQNSAVAGRRTDAERNVALESLFVRNGWQTTRLDRTLPAYRYFETMRHCVVHRAGIASQALQSKSSEATIGSSLASLPVKSSRQSRKLPVLPTIVAGERIPVLPRHSVLAGEVCFRIAEDVNANAVRDLGIGGIIWMAAHHAILSDDGPARPLRHRGPIEAIMDLLNTRYRVQGASQGECLRELRAIRKWDLVRRRFASRHA